MIDESKIVFVTTTLYSKWLDYQKKIISDLFPKSYHLIVDGRADWPYAWFYWIDKIKEIDCKWYVHIDEDCFIENREEIIKLIQKIEDEDFSLSAVSDAYHHYRGANRVAINSFFMVGRKDKLMEIDFKLDKIKFNLTNDGWRNNLDIIFDPQKHEYDFSYPHEIFGNSYNQSYEMEPYYSLLWMMKESGQKFYYLYPHFDERFKSTNPRIDSESDDIAIHMWYTRGWDQYFDVHGLPNLERYKRIEKYLKSEK